MKVNSWVRVASSTVHGQGVFALKPIPKGELLFEYAGKIISLKKVVQEIEQGKRDPYSGHTFLMVMTDQSLIDGEQGGNESRMINHSCKPNVLFVQRSPNTRPQVVSLRKIAEGEELFLDYNLEVPGDTPDSKHFASLKCLCGTATCRGSMLSKSQLRKQS